MFICLTCKSDEACINFMALKEDENFRVPCPKEGCSGELLHLDDGIAEAVALLNDKGYTTNDSCSGHFNNCEHQLTFYVSFERGAAPPVDTLPAGLMVVPGEAMGQPWDVITLPDLDFRPGLTRTEQIADVNLAFLDWVRRLPARESVSKPNQEGGQE